MAAAIFIPFNFDPANTETRSLTDFNDVAESSAAGGNFSGTWTYTVPAGHRAQCQLLCSGTGHLRDSTIGDVEILSETQTLNIWLKAGQVLDGSLGNLNNRSALAGEWKFTSKIEVDSVEILKLDLTAGFTYVAGYKRSSVVCSAVIQEYLG